MLVASVKNWGKFQHYKDRSPPWIKLQKELLDDYDYACLPLASKALAPLIWLLASETVEGTVRVDSEWLAYRLRWTVSDVIAGLNPLIDKGFLVCDSNSLAGCLQVAVPEAEREAEAEREIKISTSNEVEGEICDFTTARKPVNGKHRELVPIQQIVDLYHETLPGLRKVEKITKARSGYIRQRWLEDLGSLDMWRNYFLDVSRSPFLMGKTNGRDGKPPFVANLEWLCRPGNFAKVAEGNYHS